MFVAGIAGGWNGPSIPILTAATSPIPMTMDEGSWLITIAVYGLLLTTYPTVWLGRRIGPKRMLLVCTVPFLVGWALVALATNVATLFVSRFFFGCAYGVCYTLMPVYLSEIAADRVRGSLLAMSTVMVKCGFLFCFAVAPFVSLRTMAAVALAPCAVFACTFAWMPDSPYHLWGVGKCARAEQSLRRLRGTNDVATEIVAIELAVGEAKAEAEAGSCSGGAWRELLASEQRRALIIGVATSFVLPLSGSTAINDYSQIIFGKINWQLSAVKASILLASVQLTAAVVGTMTIDRVGRRPLLVASCAVMAMCTTLVGGYFAVERRLAWDVAAAGWLPVAALMLFQFAFSAGLEPVAATLLGEVFPKHLKPLASGVCLVVNTSADVTMGKLFQVMSDGWGSDVAFGVLAAFAGVYAVFAVRCVPETKGRRLCDILEELKGGELNELVGFSLPHPNGMNA